jgi:spoIIIJ-associated protein
MHPNPTQKEYEAYIKEALETLLRHLGVVVTGIAVDVDEKTKTTRFVIETPDSALLIGDRGDRLMAFNHIMKRMVEKHFGETEGGFMIDVNGYRKKQLDDLRAKAHMLAERARYFKSSVEMDPMSSYDRMIIHSEFSDVPDITTESTGGGKGRRIILRYVEVSVEE